MTEMTNKGRSVLDRRAFLTSGAIAAAVTRVQGALPQDDPPPPPLLDPDGPLRIGIIGRTGHLSLVFEALDSIPGARINAVAFEDGSWDHNSDGSRRGGMYNLARGRKWVEGQPWSASRPGIYETYQEMLDREALDVAVVCLPYQRNAAAIAACARAGLHVLTEKPVAVNFSDLELVERTLAEHPMRLSAMFALRYSPAFSTIRQAIAGGAVGRPCLGRAQKSYKFGDDRPWFYRSKEIYGSTILWVGIHAIDYVRWTMGLEVTSVSGFHSNLAHSGFPGLQDNAVVTLAFDGGATAAVTMDFLRPEGAPSHGDDRLRVAGEMGIIEKGGWEERVDLLAGSEESQSVELAQPPRGLFEDFVAELRGQGRHLIGPDEAVRVTRICIAATEAADSQRVVAV